MISSLIQQYRAIKKQRQRTSSKDKWYSQGQIPWQEGYVYAKEELIKECLHSEMIAEQFRKNTLPAGFGYRIDERIVEYPWIFSRLSDSHCTLLDAGSTFNFDYIVSHPKVTNKALSIFTFFPEPSCFHNKKISYQFGDLRDIPYKEQYFDEIVCQSTLEHIDMDNSIYGYDADKLKSEKSYDYMLVIAELDRILSQNGLLLLTFPYGRFENHGFFQQFDHEMLSRIEMYLSARGSIEKQFFKYQEHGWEHSSQAGCELAESHNPHTGLGKKNDHAAHSRAICCLQFKKAK
ncbi:methyltransferase domain-containing protein [Dyadobacter alkalitolerans]|uniref:methyltransferase domain-containing protein n=1 Tax=Dyadobacter alkalitolerans TaxID=492736 RepID=UPI000400B78E|nr:methyltransferase domain-containing protein [Dyadobacter alkalitolerans]